VPLRGRGTLPDISNNIILNEKGASRMNQDGLDAYRANQVMGASPGQLVLLLYDHVIKCLKNADMDGARRGIVELMGSLDLDYQEVSGRLFSLYEYCLDLVKKGEYDQACKVVTDMRLMWAMAIKKMTSQHSPTEPDKETADVKS
jgi:flagellin-specific chaperone FliS